jgi:hypothetical protein
LVRWVSVSGLVVAILLVMGVVVEGVQKEEEEGELGRQAKLTALLEVAAAAVSFLVAILVVAVDGGVVVMGVEVDTGAAVVNRNDLVTFGTTASLDDEAELLPLASGSLRFKWAVVGWEKVLGKIE